MQGLFLREKKLIIQKLFKWHPFKHSINDNILEGEFDRIDECHHAKASSYEKLWEIYLDAKFLGVTATPIRLGGAGFSRLFDVLIPSMQVNEFIQQGYLSSIKHFIGATPNLKEVKKRQEDYVTEQLERVMLDNTLMVNLLDSYRKHALDKSTIVFAVNVEHSKHIADRYQKGGNFCRTY